MKYKFFKSLIVVFGMFLLASCATTMPRELVGNYVNITPRQVSVTHQSGLWVRWGGKIIQTVPERNKTCIYILGKPLDGDNARPHKDAPSIGRFIACHAGFYDPDIYARGRELTVTGLLHGTVIHRINQFYYSYPYVTIKYMHLWKRVTFYHRYYTNSFFWRFEYNPWFGTGFYGNSMYGGDFYNYSDDDN